MKKQHILSIALVCIGLFASCNQSPIEDLSEKASKSREVIFNIGISPITRTVTDGLKSSFVSNDKIGISGINDGTQEPITQNQQFFYKENNTWSSTMGAIYFPEDGNSADFYAYYPFDETKKELVFDYSVATDQSDDYNKSDFLWAKNETIELGAKAVSLSFTHALALVEVNVTAPADETISYVEIKANATVTVDLKAQTATLKAEEMSAFIKMQKLKEKPNSYRAVVPAQMLTGRCVFISTKEGGQYPYTLSEPMEIRANTVNTFDIE